MAFYLEIEYEGDLKDDHTINQLKATIIAAVAPHVTDATKTRIERSHGRLHVRLVMNSKQMNAVNTFAKNMVDADFTIRSNPTYKFWDIP